MGARGHAIRLLHTVAVYLGIFRATVPVITSTTLVATTLTIVTCVSYPAVIFTGDLVEYYPLGISLALVSAFVLGTVISLTSSYSGSVAYAQSEPAVVVAIVVGGAVASASTASLREDVVATLIAAIAVSSVTCGVFFTILGRLRCGDLVRFVPYPVVGGFLAGVGWRLVDASLSVTIGTSLDETTFVRFIEPDGLVSWIPGVALGSALWWVQHKRQRSLDMPLLIGVAVLLFWGVALALGRSVADLSLDGWLLGPFPEADTWSPTNQVSALLRADWKVVSHQVVELGTLVALSTITLLLTANSIELSVRRDIDLDRELGYVGVANILGGLAGGLPGYHSLSVSVLSDRLGAPVRVCGLGTAILCLMMLIHGLELLTYIPKLVVGGVLFYVGVGFLVEWIYRGWFRISRPDYLVLVLVFLVVVLFGFIEAIVAGMLFGLVIFAISYSRLGVTRAVADGTVIHSNVERSAVTNKVLADLGRQIFVLRLQGYIFFGSANSLVKTVRGRIQHTDQPALRFLVLDFTLVSGFDSSAVASFDKMLQYASENNFVVVLAALPDRLRHVLGRNTSTDDPGQDMQLFPDGDRALEWCENRLLESSAVGLRSYGTPFEEVLKEIFQSPADRSEFLARLECRDFGPDEQLIEQGALSDDMYFIESGEVAITLGRPGAPELRLRKMHAGTIVGEIAFYLGVPRSASVVALSPTRTYRLSRSALRELEMRNPGLATLFHEYIARGLATKLVDTTRVVGTLYQ